MRVFISYASEDQGLAEQVHLALTGAGHRTFFDRESLPPGGDFHARIAAAIAASDLLVYLVSPHSTAEGSYALTELKLARARWRHPKGKVLPVMAAPVAWELIPNYLKAVTVLQPDGNVPAEVVIAVAGLGQRRRRVLLVGAAGVGAAVAVVAAIFMVWRDSAPDHVAPAPAASAALGVAPAAARAALADLRCTTGQERNPLARRAAELVPPAYSVDSVRHLLLDGRGQPVSVVPAASLGTLQRRQFIVAHFTAAPASAAAKMFESPDAVGSVHVLIMRDGTVHQLVPFDFASRHAGVSNWKGVSGLNAYSIGIGLDNWGGLARDGSRWKSWSGEVIPTERVALVGQPPTGWEAYTPDQLRAFFHVSCALRRAYPTLEELVGHEQISPQRKTDPGPAFPLAELQQRVFGLEAVAPTPR